MKSEIAQRQHKSKKAKNAPTKAFEQSSTSVFSAVNATHIYEGFSLRIFSNMIWFKVLEQLCPSKMIREAQLKK